MRSTSFLALTVFLVFVTLVAGKRTKEDKVKAGICPIDSRLCFNADLPRCERDKHCVGNKKCCFVDCGFRCVVPVKTLKKENPVKGYSLVQDSVKGRIKGRGQVQHLIQVQGQAKRKAKGKHQVPAKANKRGACPTILTHCTVLNPPNLCHSDTECPGAKKCCAGHCGMTCLEPQ